MKIRRPATATAHATVIAYLALFMALSGTATAAAVVWTGANIVDGSLTGADVADGSVSGEDIAAGSLSTSDISAPLVQGNARVVSGSADLPRHEGRTNQVLLDVPGLVLLEIMGCDDLHASDDGRPYGYSPGFVRVTNKSSHTLTMNGALTDPLPPGGEGFLYGLPSGTATLREVGGTRTGVLTVTAGLHFGDGVFGEERCSFDAWGIVSPAA